MTTPATAVATVTEHRCPRSHRAHRALAACAYPRTGWITGDGPFVVVVTCGVGHVRLHPDETTARTDLDRLAVTGCGGRCTRAHNLARIDLDHQTPRRTQP